MIVAGKLGYGAWRDGRLHHPRCHGCRPAEIIVAHQLVAAIFRAARNTARCRCRGATSRSWRMRRTPRKCAKRVVPDLRDRWCGYRKIPVTISTMPVPHDRGLFASPPALSVRIISMRTGLVPSRAREAIFLPPTMAGRRPRVRPQRSVCAEGVGVLAARRRQPKLIDPRPNVALAAKNSRCLCDAGWSDLYQRLERWTARARISRLTELNLLLS